MFIDFRNENILSLFGTSNCLTVGKMKEKSLQSVVGHTGKEKPHM